MQDIANSATKKEEKVAEAKKWELTIGMTPLDATDTVPVDRKKPIGAYIKFEKKYMLKWRLLGAMKRRIYLSEYLWQEKATKIVAAQSRMKADKEKYTEVAKKQKIMWEMIRHTKAPLIIT